ncbi:MAG: response regulator [Rhodocyclaceae bacterium]|nr:response regulator [Rhodocyclaceae bacterium]
MQARPLRRLSVRLVLATLALSLLISMAIAARELWNDYQQTQRSLDIELARIQTTHVPLVAAAVWTYDQAQLERSADSLLAIPGVVRVRIADPHKTLLDLGKSQEGAEQRSYDLSAMALGAQTKAGELHVIIDRQRIRGELWQKYGGAFRNALLQLSLATLLMLALFEWMVTRHLRKMARFVSTRTPDNLEEPLHLSRLQDGNVGDEIDLLADGFAGMQRSLHSAILNLEHDVRLRMEVESQVRDLNASLEQKVQARTRELQRAKQSAENVLELTHSAFWFYDLVTPVLWLDERAATLMGFAINPAGSYAIAGFYDGVAAVSPEFAERLAHMRSGEDSLPGREGALKRMRELGFMAQEGTDGQEVSFSTVYRRPSDGRTIWLNVLARLTLETDEHAGLIGSVQDVTAAKRTEQALAVARDAADAANRAKSDFLANMSHEIRTPLNGLLGMVQLLERTALDERQRGFLAKQRYSADALLRVVNDVLDFSKVEAGQLAIESAEFDLHELMHNTLDLLSVRAEEKGLAVALDIAPATPRWVRGDMLRLGQVLTNLSNNALKFTEAGRLCLRVQPAGKLSEGMQTLRFVVEDTGIGMDEEQLGRLFKSFQQADTSISRRFGGTGLGLAICKRLVELMGGTIGARSVPGQGSVFFFTLPLRLGAAGEAGDHDRAVLRAATTTSAGKSLGALASAAVGASVESLARIAATEVPESAPLDLAGVEILLVDDNLINQEVARAFLTAEGAQVTLADDGAQAVQWVTRRRAAGQPPFAAVLMDIQMPLMDGFAATAALRADPANAALPIIAMTAHGLSGDRERSLAAGMNDHVVKPVVFDALMAALARALSPRRAASDPECRAPVPVTVPVASPLVTDMKVPEGLEVIQIEEAMSRLRGRGALYLRLIKLFVSQGGELLAAYHAAADAPAQAAVAHKIKGTAGNMGMVLVAELAMHQEYLAKSGQTIAPAEVAQLCTLLETAVAEAHAILDLNHNA